MAIEIQLATTPDLKDAAYELRYRVFREEQYELGSETFNLRRFVDFWDTFDTTYTFVAIADGKVVSTLRAVVENALGLPEVPYDFGPFRKSLGAVPVTFFGRLATDPEYRSGGLGVLLQEAAVTTMRKLGVHYVLGLANTRYTEWWERFGYVWIDEATDCPGAAIQLRPHYLDLINLPERLVARDFFGMARIFRNDARWAFLKQDEILYRDGEPGDTAWEILSGEVEVSQQGQVQRYGPGALIGELAILGPGSHVGNARIATEEVVCAPMSRARFQERLAGSSEMERRMLEELASKYQALVMRPIEKVR